MIPAAIQLAAASRLGSVGQEVDSTGKHVAYWYAPPNAGTWRIYRATAAGMVAVLRNVPKVSP